MIVLSDIFFGRLIQKKKEKKNPKKIHRAVASCCFYIFSSEFTAVYLSVWESMLHLG